MNESHFETGALTKLLIISIAYLGALFALHGSNIKLPSWVVENGSHLSIEGSSNINQFTCHVKKYLRADTLRWVREEQARKLRFHQSAVNIDLNEFDCHHRFITADLRKTLKVNQYPYLRIHFITMEDPNWVQDGQIIRGLVQIELAGKAKQYGMEYQLIHEQGGRFRLIGSKQVYLSDFSLVPPSKLAGLVKINEAIRVNFELQIKSHNQ